MVELFQIGFLKITLIDIVDIVVVGLILHRLYLWMRGTIASQIFLGLMFIVVLAFVAQILNLKLLNWLLRFVTDIWVIAFIVLFQPEIRRLLMLVGRNPLLRMFIRPNIAEVVNEVIEAVSDMARNQIGALIVLTRHSGIRMVVETGVSINARVSKELLKSIFFPRSPLHDGAVIISGDKIEAAACTLPLSHRTRIGGFLLGTRHRAALGISEVSDALAIVVSEETGTISIAENGQLIRGLSPEGLRKRLLAELQAIDKTPREIFETISRNE